MRAILLDLDNTIYPERRFIISGFAAVAREVERRFGVSDVAAFRCLCGALRSGSRAEALQRLCAELSLPDGFVAEGVAIIRGHAPSLRLDRHAREALRELRGSWRVGLLTNGIPAVQARKVEALGLRAEVDDIVYASLHGGGKPDPLPFLLALDRLEVEPSRAVMAGDDHRCDIQGARSAGLRTIRVMRWANSDGSGDDAPDAVAQSLRDVPAIAAALVKGVYAHAA